VQLEKKSFTKTLQAQEKLTLTNDILSEVSVFFLLCFFNQMLILMLMFLSLAGKVCEWQ
jgi:hypothetical protein